MSSTERRAPARVLIVETRETLARHYWVVLKEAGRLDAQWTSNTASVKSTMHTFQPQLLIVGDDLQEHCGLELCGTIRQFSTIPLILITSSADHSQWIRCLNAGADDCITLPLEPPYLLARVFALLRRAYRYSAGSANSGANRNPTPFGDKKAPSLGAAPAKAAASETMACGACNHRASRVRFELAGTAGGLNCPACGERARESFTLG